MTETLATYRCPLCAWVGESDTDLCPQCGYGLVAYEVTLHD